MKKLCAFIIMVFITVFSVASISAEDNFKISFSTDEIHKNRLFEISVYNDSEVEVCAGEVVLTFDEKIVEFRKVNSEYFDVKAKEKDNTVHIVFASANPQNMDNKLFSVTFKSIEYGNFDMNADCFSCVDANLNMLNECSFAVNIEVNSSSVKLRIKETSDRESSFSSKADNLNVTESLVSSPDIIYVDGKNDIYIIIMISLAVCGIALISFYLGMLFQNKMRNNKSQKDSSQD